jgi:hypothetical protein
MRRCAIIMGPAVTISSPPAMNWHRLSIGVTLTERLTEEFWGDSSDACYSVDVTPKPEPIVGCSTKSCPGRGGFKR